MNTEKTALTKHYNLLLKNRLQNCGTPPAQYEAKSYTLKVIEEMFKDPTIDVSDLAPTVRAAYTDWLNLDLPLYLRNKVQGAMDSALIPYNKLNRETKE